MGKNPFDGSQSIKSNSWFNFRADKESKVRKEARTSLTLPTLPCQLGANRRQPKVTLNFHHHLIFQGLGWPEDPPDRIRTKS